MDSEWRKDGTPEGVDWLKIARTDVRTTPIESYPMDNPNDEWITRMTKCHSGWMSSQMDVIPDGRGIQVEPDQSETIQERAKSAARANLRSVSR
ncbi:unnamed protein product [Phytophthora fragariaefolia]|uniref:Unnamed protein product n=1 Tax=Phytophthora fragariaefolia TaxID=1490495 RepID=A0A9W6YC31_9STRA|nr:unnamed protein product [Phytophthora fragariaefolia]